MEGNYHFCFVLLCFEGNFRVQAPRGGLYLEGQFNGGCFALRVWGAYIWRGLFSEFYGMFVKQTNLKRTPLLGIGTMEVPVGVFTVHIPLYILLNNSFLWHL